MSEPDLELPKTLRNMLGSIMCNNILFSWNIASNGHNQIMLYVLISAESCRKKDRSLAVCFDMTYRKQHEKAPFLFNIQSIFGLI